MRRRWKELWRRLEKSAFSRLEAQTTLLLLFAIATIRSPNSKSYLIQDCLFRSVPTVCSVAGWTRSPLSPPMLSRHRWPARGPSSSLRASPTLHQTPLPWHQLLNFSPQKATLTITPLPSECQNPRYAQGEFIFDCWESLLSFRFSFEREGSPEEFYNPSEDAEPGMGEEFFRLRDNSPHVLMSYNKK